MGRREPPRNEYQIENLLLRIDENVLMINEKINHPNETDKFIILLAGARGSEPIPGRLHLQTEMYLLHRLFSDLEAGTDYDTYLTESHSEIIANSLKKLESSGMITESSDSIRLTSDGNHVFMKLLETSNKKEIAKVKEFKELLNDMTR